MRAYKAGKRAAVLLLLCVLALSVSGCGDQSGGYDKAIALFGEGDYAAAATAFAGLGDYLDAKTYAAYAQGLTFYEQGNYTAAEPYFEQTRSFMYGEQRYSLCHAAVLEAAGQYGEAATWYEKLGEFEDAPKRAAYCKARLAMENADYETALAGYQDAIGYSDAAERLDALNFEIYERATALKDEQSYEQAFKLFTLLGDNYDAREQARICKNYSLDQTYAAAEALIASGDLRGAYDQFSVLAGYRDAATRATELAAKLGIDTAGGE
jgi:tetratricopeptide (TPR) repeat protein